MNLKLRYIMKYIFFRLIPEFLIIGAVSAMLIWISMADKSSFALTASIIASAIALSLLLLYHSFNIINFLKMIKRQEKQYNIIFDDKNFKIYAKYSLWIVCSDYWLIRPGKYAIYRKAIESASIGEAHPQKGGIIYLLKIKTHWGKAFSIKFKNEKDAKAVKNWARR